MNYEFQTITCREELLYAQWLGQKPEIETAEQILMRMACDGWEFCGLIPGNGHEIAEFRAYPRYMFKRPSVPPDSPA